MWTILVPGSGFTRSRDESFQARTPIPHHDFQGRPFLSAQGLTQAPGLLLVLGQEPKGLASNQFRAFGQEGVAGTFCVNQVDPVGVSFLE